MRQRRAAVWAALKHCTLPKPLKDPAEVHSVRLRPFLGRLVVSGSRRRFAALSHTPRVPSPARTLAPRQSSDASVHPRVPQWIVVVDVEDTAGHAAAAAAVAAEEAAAGEVAAAGAAAAQVAGAAGVAAAPGCSSATAARARAWTSSFVSTRAAR
jgi:hypothetical protein